MAAGIAGKAILVSGLQDIRKNMETCWEG